MMEQFSTLIMGDILDTTFDSEFDKIENLTWYPWVGKNTGMELVEFLLSEIVIMPLRMAFLVRNVMMISCQRR